MFPLLLDLIGSLIVLSMCQWIIQERSGVQEVRRPLKTSLSTVIHLARDLTQVVSRIGCRYGMAWGELDLYVLFPVRIRI